MNFDLSALDNLQKKGAAAKNTKFIPTSRTRLVSAATFDYRNGLSMTHKLCLCRRMHTEVLPFMQRSSVAKEENQHAHNQAQPQSKAPSEPALSLAGGSCARSNLSSCTDGAKVGVLAVRRIVCSASQGKASWHSKNTKGRMQPGEGLQH